MVARFRSACGKFAEDPWIEHFVNELKSESTEFASLWPMHNVRTEEERFKTVIHPVLGSLEFEIASYLVSDNTHLKMTVFTPLPGTDTGEKIRRFLLKQTL